MDGWIEYVNGRGRGKWKMLGLVGVLVGVFFIKVGRINRLPICIYGMEDLWMRYGYEV